jgi:hypothetical protein
MKFPKEKVRLIQIINSYKKNQEYHSIILLKDDIKEKIEELKDTTIIDDVIISMFHLNRYDDMVIFGEELSKKGYESWVELYYLLLACLGNLDVFYGMSIIKRSNLLMDEKMKEFYCEDGSNYMNIYLSNKLTKVEKLVLILVNFMGGLLIATQSKFVVDKEFLAIRFFEMMDTLYELGNREEIIDDLTDKIKMIFFVEV